MSLTFCNHYSFTPGHYVYVSFMSGMTRGTVHLAAASTASIPSVGTASIPAVAKLSSTVTSTSTVTGLTTRSRPTELRGAATYKAG